MYRISINEELEFDVYKKLIDFAFEKSDAIMSVTYRFSEDIESRYTIKDKSIYDSEEEYLRFLKIYERMKKEAYEYHRIFKNSTEQFLEKMRPYLIKIRNHPTEWPSCMITFDHPDDGVDICTYRICSEVKSYILQGKGLFNWKYPNLPDDLCFFLNGYCWFCTVSHEGYATMFLSDFKEVEKLRKIGLKFELTECKDEEVKLFHEDY
ncbi:hypothetical protein SH2C18_03880 [Clostridium sediminicola]|uniref:hypothetical protein n=1 Tax=Clostridium sediminicola TaxID=3114879 RepID=UPI0031F21F52